MLLINAPQCEDRTRARYCRNVAGEADWYRAYCVAAEIHRTAMQKGAQTHIAASAGWSCGRNYLE